MKYRRPFAIAASAVMLAGSAAADQMPAPTPDLDVTVIQQDLQGETAHLFVPVLALLLIAAALHGGGGAAGPSLTYF